MASVQYARRNRRWFIHLRDWPIMRAVSPGSGSEVVEVVKPIPRLRLQGFNNLTKALSFNIYDICYAVSEDQRQRYIEYIDEAYNAERLTTILTDVADIIGANILNVARQDYDPQGASVTILISEEPVVEKLGRDTISGAVVAHLDKSHITVHTYPETHPHNGIATFRADIDVATCGGIGLLMPRPPGRAATSRHRRQRRCRPAAPRHRPRRGQARCRADRSFRGLGQSARPR